MDKRVMILGAGSTGRGHIGELAFSAGWDVVLVDRDRALVEALRERGQYRVTLYTPETSRVVTVDRFAAYHYPVRAASSRESSRLEAARTGEVDDTDAIMAQGLRVSLILTALFSQNLPQIAPLVARIIMARGAAGVDEPLNVICCENMQDSSSVLQSLVWPLLDEATQEYAARLMGFPDCMVSRVVPVPEGDPLALVAEDYNEWTVDAGGFVGPPPDLPAMELVADQETRLARKFFMHNGAHAVSGYWGFHRGHTYIHEAIADPFVRDHVLAAVEELAAVVARRYGLDLEEVRAYGLSLGARGAVAQLKDLILRVVRDPLRKLSRPERFAAPARLALEYGLPCGEIVAAIAAALRYSHPDDPQSVAMQEQLQGEGPRVAIQSILGLPDRHPLIERAVVAYESWTPPAAP